MGLLVFGYRLARQRWRDARLDVRHFRAVWHRKRTGAAL